MTDHRAPLWEDFFPLSRTHCLVTSGWALSNLSRIEKARYTVAGGKVLLIDEPWQIVATGTHCRLGGQWGDQLVYSDTAKGIVGCGGKASRTAHQPFLYGGHLYYTDFLNRHDPKKLIKLYRDGELFIDHFWHQDHQYVQVGNICITPNGDCYFEARWDTDPKRPELWEIWKRTSQGELSFVCIGANPAHFEEEVYAGKWNGKNFDYQVIES